MRFGERMSNGMTVNEIIYVVSLFTTASLQPPVCHFSDLDGYFGWDFRIHMRINPFFRWTMELHIGRRMIYIFANLRFVLFQPIMITGNSMHFISVTKVKQMNSAFRVFRDSMLTFPINRIWRPMWKWCIEFIIAKDLLKFRETVRMYD